jgi:hypothetical protein
MCRGPGLILWYKRDMRFGTWNVRSLYRSGSLKIVARGLTKYKLHLLGMQFVSDMMSYIVLRGCWCNIVLNLRAPIEEKSGDSKDNMRN